MPKRRGYVTVLFGFNYETDDEVAEMRSEIVMDAEDTAQRYDFIDHWEVHHENMLAFDSGAKS